MSYQLSEKDVLKKLGIEDFRHLSKANIMHFASMLDRMDPEVAKKALEQFPTFASTSKEILLDYKDTLDKGIESNNKNMQRVYDTYNGVMASLQKQLDKDDLSFEDKKYIIGQMKEIAEKMDRKDSENKRFVLGALSIAATVVIAVVGGLFGALGGDTNAVQDNRDDQM